MKVLFVARNGAHRRFLEQSVQGVSGVSVATLDNVGLSRVHGKRFDLIVSHTDELSDNEQSVFSVIVHSCLEGTGRIVNYD